MTLETILRTVLHAIAWSAFVAFCGVVAGLGVRWMMSKLGHALAVTGRRCGKWASVTLASLALVCAVVAQKANTNDAPNGVAAPAPMMSAARGAPETNLQNPTNAPETFPLNSVARGAPPTFPPRLAAQRPANAQDVEAWKLRGAYDDAIRIPAIGWDFRTTNGFVEGMTVFSRGEFRPDVGHLYFPRPFTNDLALLPQSRWTELPRDGEGGTVTPESKLWYAATPSNSLLVTWVNGLLDRNPLTPTNFQAEFFPDGSYEYRYPDHRDPHPFMLPFDCDGDGLENTVDPEPETAGPDAHNTNDEWKRIVCSNLYEEVEGEGSGLVWKSDENAAAYYFVDVVAEHGPTPIYFNAGDDGGNLGSPVVVAMQGVTNHIPLLIGVTYSVTSDVPFSVSLPEDGYATVETNDALNLTISWPLDFWFMEAGEGSHAFYVGCGPVDPGGMFVWDWEIDAGGSGGPSLMGTSPEWPRCFVGSSTYVWADCGTGNCGCGGCYATGTYEYEGRICTVAGGWCGCESHPSDDGGDDPPPPAYDPPTLSCSFSRPVVIFEDAYTNAPGEVVARQSDTTTLEVVAYGGDEGGTLTVDVSNLEKLEQLTALAFPSTITVARHQEVALSVSFKGLRASAAENDIVATATFGSLSKTAAATAVGIDVISQVTVTDYPRRHKWGVGEDICCVWTPQVSNMRVVPMNGSVARTTYQHQQDITCPWHSATSILKFECGDFQYIPNSTVLEPQSIEARNAEQITFSVPVGVPGGTGFSMDLYILPDTVSFQRLKFMEEPSYDSRIEGYFTNSAFSAVWYHTTERSAGEWHNIQGENFWFRDEATMGDALILPCFWGILVWNIPIIWIDRDETYLSEKQLASVPQTFSMNSQGCLRVSKYQYWSERSLNGRLNKSEGMRE